jgi:AcrR family transcriptional regulator
VGRPKKPIISKQLVIDTALRLIDEKGLEAISLRRLAETIGVNPGSLYYHYRYKDDILHDVLTHVLAPLEPSPEPVDDWKAYFRDRCRTYFRLMVEHPNLTALMFALLPRTLGLPVENQGAQVLLGQGVPAGYIPIIREQLESAVHGVLRFSFDSPLFDQIPADYPTLARVVTESQAVPPEERLDLVVGVILDGIELHLTRWRADPPDRHPRPSMPSRATVNISSSPSRSEAAAPG